MLCELWFGDERGYNATGGSESIHPESCGLVMKEDITQQTHQKKDERPCCGLVMKEDITQLYIRKVYKYQRCGLVMKEDITQPFKEEFHVRLSCGLVMKEDITQRDEKNKLNLDVVVW